MPTVNPTFKKRDLDDFKFQFALRRHAGQHIQADHEWEPTEQEVALAKESGRVLRAPSRVFVEGDVIPSDTDLVKRFGHEKFEYVSGAPSMRRTTRKAAAPTEDEGPDVSAMTVPELRKMAEANEIDTRGFKTKEDYVKALKKS